MWAQDSKQNKMRNFDTTKELYCSNEFVFELCFLANQSVKLKSRSITERSLNHVSCDVGSAAFQPQHHAAVYTLL